MSRKTPLFPLLLTFVGIIATLYLLQTITPANRILGLRSENFQDTGMSWWQVTLMVILVIALGAASMQGGVMFGFF